MTPPRRPDRPLGGIVAALARGVIGLALGAFGLMPQPAATQPAARGSTDGPAQVLVINGADAYLPAFVSTDAGMRAAVARRSDRPVVWLYETLDALRFRESGAREELAALLARKYAGTRIDVVVLVSEPALAFYLRHRERLWPEARAVFHSVPTASLPGLALGTGISGFPVEPDYAQTLEIALALQPRARRLVVVAGVSPFDEAELARARLAVQRRAGKLEVEYLVGASLEALRDRLSRESPDTVVLFVNMFRDAQGQVYTPRDALAAFSAASGAPVYGVAATQLGSGMTAGAVESFEDRGTLAGELVVEALRSPPGAPARVLPAPAPICVADGRELARFGLRAAALPPGCDLRFVEPPFLQRYWWQSLLVALALAGQSALIAALLVQRRRRRAAEISVQAQRAQLLHSSRLAVAGELTASIAHEINQPLGAILSNADAAELLLNSGKASRDELLQILADIRRDDLRASEVIRRLRSLLARHEVERRRIALHQVIEDTAAILRNEARRRGATIELALQARNDAVLGDPVQLQQAVLNLVLNAFDASGSLPPERRLVRIETADAPEGVATTVRDLGTGIAAADLPRVFDSFFSTKGSGMGLGLSIARSIVEAHGGTISAARREPGTEFRIVLPLAPADEPTTSPSPS